MCPARTKGSAHAPANPPDASGTVAPADPEPRSRSRCASPSRAITPDRGHAPRIQCATASCLQCDFVQCFRQAQDIVRLMRRGQ